MLRVGECSADEWIPSRVFLLFVELWSQSHILEHSQFSSCLVPTTHMKYKCMRYPCWTVHWLQQQTTELKYGSMQASPKPALHACAVCTQHGPSYFSSNPRPKRSYRELLWMLTLRTCTLLTQPWIKKLYPSNSQFFFSVEAGSANQIIMNIPLAPEMVVPRHKTRVDVRVIHCPK